MNDSNINKTSNEKYLRTVFDASSDAMIIVDRQAIILDCNRQFCVDVAKPVSELLGISLWSVTAEAAAYGRKEKFEEVVRTGKQAKFESFSQSGWIDITITSLGFDRFVFFARDITEFKKSEFLESINEKRHKALAVLGQMYEADFEEILEYALESAIEQALSLGGFIAEIEEDQTITLKVIKGIEEQTSIIDGFVELDIDDFKHIQEVLISKKPITFYTATASMPSRDGKAVTITSNGAIIPILAQGEVKLLLGVHDKREQYSETDCIGLMHFMDGVWRLKERIDTEDTINSLNTELEKKVTFRTAQLRESEVRFRTAFESTANGMVIVSLN